jgi:hypothetical protein
MMTLVLGKLTLLTIVARLVDALGGCIAIQDLLGL